MHTYCDHFIWDTVLCLFTSSSDRTSEITREKQEPSASSPTPTSQDNFDTVDMDVCDTYSDPGTQSPSDHIEQINSHDPVTNPSASPADVNNTKSEPTITKDDHPPTSVSESSVDTESRPADSEAPPSETISDSTTSAHLPTPLGTEREDSPKGDTVESPMSREHSPSFSVKVSSNLCTSSCILS